MYLEKDREQNQVEIEPEEYIIGSLYQSDDVNKNGLYEYYIIKLPYDLSSIEIDWQSNTAELLIKLDDGRPSLKDNDFHYKERKDTNIIIKKEEIMEKLES